MNKKTALILHGWPQFRLEKYFLTIFLKGKGYKVLIPNMFVREYVFSPENVLKKVRNMNGKSDIDLIVGISLGGLIAPYIAREYPKAKIILIGTAPRLKTDVLIFNIYTRIAKFKPVKKLLLPILIDSPKQLMLFLYHLGNPFSGSPERIKQYKTDADLNIDFIKKIPISEEEEILDFILTTNNTVLLKSLKNESIIFCGKNDLLMGRGGVELGKLLCNSKTYFSKGSHFDAFTEQDLEKIDKFIN